MGSITIKKYLALLFFACGFGLVISNVLLVRRITQIQRLDDQLNTSNRLEPGSAVPALVGYDPSGKKLTFNYGEDSRETVLLIFSPGCHACDDNWPNWTRLIKGLNSQSTRLVIANLASNLPVSGEYVAKHEFGSVPLITELSPESMQAYHLLYTPQTILVGRDGKVRKVETGAFHSEDFALGEDCSPAGQPCAGRTGPVASLSR